MTYFKAQNAATIDRLKEITGPTGWREGEDAQRYFEDPRDRFSGRGRLVLLPGSTEEVAQIVRACAAERAGIIPYGGGTGVVAGQLSPDEDNAIILSLERMNRIREVWAEDFAMVAEAGCILEYVHAAAAEHRLTFPLSMASKGSCTIGGNLATNAGGIQVLRHGNARDLCLGIEAVLPSGEVLSELSPLRKNNTGYDLRHLLIGSEGTLGIITAATLVLKAPDPATVTALCVISSPAGALEIYCRLRSELGESLSGLELISGFGLTLVTRHFPDLRNPFAGEYNWCMLAEFSGRLGLQEQVEAALADEMQRGLLADAVIATSEAQRSGLWRLRENMPEANRLAGAFCNSDTSVPLSCIDDFIAVTHAEIAAIHPGLRVNSYGHIGDGNIHHNVFPPDGISKRAFLHAQPEMIDLVRHAINDSTRQFDGSISAEHGIGRLKRGDLRLYGSHARLDTIRHIKAALDPQGIMNPGAILD